MKSKAYLSRTGMYMQQYKQKNEGYIVCIIFNFVGIFHVVG